MQLPSPLAQRLTNMTRLSAALAELRVAMSETQRDLDENPLSAIVAGHFGGSRLVVESDGTVLVQGAVTATPTVVPSVNTPLRVETPPPASEYPPGYVEEIVEDVEDPEQEVVPVPRFEPPEDLSFLMDFSNIQPPAPSPFTRPPGAKEAPQPTSAPPRVLQGKSLSQIALTAEQDTDMDRYTRT